MHLPACMLRVVWWKVRTLVGLDIYMATARVLYLDDTQKHN